MPYLLQDLFKETKNHGIRKKDKKRMSRSCKYIKNYQLLPELPCPEPDGEIHKNDIEDLLKYYHDPVLPEKFLTRSHDSVKRLFKDYCKENEFRSKAFSFCLKNQVNYMTYIELICYENLKFADTLEFA